jgi:hypothetical protein
MAASCAKPADPDSPDHWLFLFHDYPPTRQANLWVESADTSCLRNGLTTVRGYVDGESMRQLVSLTRQRYPDDAVIAISSNGPYAEVVAGSGCRKDTESGEGRVLWYRFERSRWMLKEDSSWVG